MYVLCRVEEGKYIILLGYSEQMMWIEQMKQNKQKKTKKNEIRSLKIKCSECKLRIACAFKKGKPLCNNCWY